MRQVRTVRNPCKRVVKVKKEKLDSDSNKLTAEESKHVNENANKLTSEESKYLYEKIRTRSQTNVEKVSKKSPAVKKKAPQKLGRPYRYCCFIGCNRNNHHNVSFKRLTRMPDKEPSPTDTIDRHKLYILKKSKRREQLDRCGLSREDNRQSLRIYSDHEYESIKIYHTLQHNGKVKNWQ